MMPSIIYETLAASFELAALGIGAARIIESQSVDYRPFEDGYFITVAFDEMLMSGVSKLARGPRTVTLAVHRSWEIDRDYAPITAILNICDTLLLPLEDTSGADGVRLTSVRRTGRSGNLADEGWKTITRTTTYGVLYNEFDVVTS